MSRHRHFVFTINNYTPQDEEKLCALAQEVRYIVWGYEVAPSTETPHLQGFVSYANPRSAANVARVIGGHVEPARGTPAQAAEYCKKEGTFFEAGEVPVHSDSGGRERERWDSVRRLAESGQYADVPSDIFIRYFGAITRIRNLWLSQNCPPDLDQLENYWIKGETGSGKSRSVRDIARARDLRVYLKEPNKWWDGYDGEPIVLIEELAPEHRNLLGSYLKIWTDHYQFRCENKGGSLVIRPKCVVVTSNWDMQTIFHLEGEYAPLARRFTYLDYDEGEKLTEFKL